MEKWLNRKRGITPLTSRGRWWRFDPVYCFPLLLVEACKVSVRLEALAVDDGGAALVVLLLGDPHPLEGGEGSQDGASDPDVALHDGVVGGLVDAAGLHSQEAGLEESLGTPET